MRKVCDVPQTRPLTTDGICKSTVELWDGYQEERERVIWNSNIAAINRRWPALAARLAATEIKHAEVRNGTLCYRGLQVVSAYDRLAEAEAQASAMVNPTRCYGIGLGELPTLLAARGPIEIVLLNLEIARRALSHVGMPWLHMDGVELRVADEVEWKNEAFAAVAMECWLADEQGYEVRDRVFMKIQDGITRMHLELDRERITEQFTTNKARSHYLAAALYGTAPGSRAVVVGGGPTLTEQLPWLKESRHKHTGLRPLIAAPAALRPLLAAGIVPDVVVLMESSTSNLGYLDGLDMTRLERTALAYNPECDPRFLDAWPGPLCDFGDPFLRGTVLHSCADLACRMGAAEVTLLGFDCCRPGGRDYADGAGVPGEGYPDSPYRMWELDGYGKRVTATPGMARWLRGMEDLIALRPGVTFYKRGRAGVALKGATWTD